MTSQRTPTASAKRALFPILGLLALLAGCNAPAELNRGPIRARTFSFAVPRPGAAQFADDRAQAHAMIQEAITKNLAAKGLEKAETGGDVTVAYLIVIGNPVSTTTINDYYGYSDDTAGLINRAHKAYTSGSHPGYFEAGTLVIDIVDANGTVGWRSHATRPRLGDVTAEVRAEHIQGAVDEALAKLKIAK